MSPRKTITTCLALLGLLTGWLSVAAAQGPCVGGMCRHGIARHRCLEVGCAPRSAFYNYYPTTWRRWPTDTSAAPTPAIAPPANQEPAAAPAGQEAAPQVQPEQPSQPQIEDDTIAPSETAPGATGPEPAPPLPADEEMLPFQDVPSGPATPPSQDALPGADAPPALPSDSITDPGLPGLPPSTTPSIPEEGPGGTPDPMEDAPPTMPEDPFQDDPVQPQTTPTAPTGMNEASGPVLSRHEAPAAKHWRAAGASSEPRELPAPPVARSLVPQETSVAPSLLASYPNTKAADPAPVLVQDNVPQQAQEQSSGPRLLPPVDGPAQDIPAASSADAVPARRNPLRTASTTAPARPVATVAAWTADDVEPAIPAGANRRNPLRDN